MDEKDRAETDKKMVDRFGVPSMVVAPSQMEGLQRFIRQEIEETLAGFFQMWESNPTTAPWNLPPHSMEESIARHRQDILNLEKWAENHQEYSLSLVHKNRAVGSPQDTESHTTGEHSDVGTVPTPHLTLVSQHLLGGLTEAESSHVERCFLCAVVLAVSQSESLMPAQGVAGGISTLVKPPLQDSVEGSIQGQEPAATISQDSQYRSFNEMETKCATYRHEQNDWGLVHIAGFPEIRCYKHETPDHYMIMMNGDTTTPRQVLKK